MVRCIVALCKDVYEIKAEKCVMHNGKCWFVPSSHNALCTLDVMSGDISVEVWGLGGESGLCQGRYVLAGAVGNKLVMVPEYAEKVLIYDTESGTSECYPVNVPELKGKSGGGKFIKFRSAITLGSDVWILPQSTGHILKYDAVKMELADYVDWYDVVAEYNWHDVNQFGFGVCVDYSIWLPCYQINALLEFNILSHQGKIHFIGKHENRFIAVTYCENKFWLLDNINQELVTWHPSQGILNVTKEFPNEYGADKAYFNFPDYNIAELCVVKDKIVAVPSAGNAFLCVDVFSSTIEKIVDKLSGSNYLHLCKIDSERYIALSQTDNRFCVFNVETCMVEKYIYPKLDYRILEKYLGFVYESKQCRLDDFLMNINTKGPVNVEMGSLCGKNIYRFV